MEQPPRLSVKRKIWVEEPASSETRDLEPSHHPSDSEEEEPESREEQEERT